MGCQSQHVHVRVGLTRGVLCGGMVRVLYSIRRVYGSTVGSAVRQPWSPSRINLATTVQKGTSNQRTPPFHELLQRIYRRKTASSFQCQHWQKHGPPVRWTKSHSVSILTVRLTEQYNLPRAQSTHAVRLSRWVDTYASEFSRDMEPTVEGGDHVWKVATSCVQMYVPFQEETSVSAC